MMRTKPQGPFCNAEIFDGASRQKTINGAVVFVTKRRQSYIGKSLENDICKRVYNIRLR